MRISRRNVLFGLGGVMAAAALPRAAGAPIDDAVPRAVREIIEGIERSRDKTPPGKTLFVPMGEVHSSAAQKLVMQSVLQELKERGHKIAFGVEEQYDLLTDLTEPGNPAPLPEIAYRLVDPDGRQVLRALNHTPRLYSYADQSTKSLMNFCEQQRVSTGFNDLSRVEMPYFGALVIDPNDGLAQQLIEALELDVNGVLDTRDPVAMALRNAAITYNAMAHAADAGAEIYLQHCGYAHLFGEGTAAMPFDRSLADLFNIQGNRAFAVDLFGIPALPDEAKALIGGGRALSVSYLPTDAYDYTTLKQAGAIAALQRRERAYLEKAVRNTKYVVCDPVPETGAGQAEKAPGPTP